MPAQARVSGPITVDWAFQEEGFLKRRTLKQYYMYLEVIQNKDTNLNVSMIWDLKVSYISNIDTIKNKHIFALLSMDLCFNI